MTNDAPQNLPKPSRNWAGRIWKMFLGLGLILAGSFFAWWLWAAWQKAKLMDPWIEAQATISSSEIQEWRYNEFSRPQYIPKVIYSFDIEEQTQFSDQIRRIPIRSSTYDKAMVWTRKFPAGIQTSVWYDPKDPKRSVLKKDSKASIYSIWFPCLFVVGGIGIIYTALRSD